MKDSGEKEKKISDIAKREEEIMKFWQEKKITLSGGIGGYPDLRKVQDNP